MVYLEGAQKEECMLSEKEKWNILSSKEERRYSTYVSVL